MAAKSPNQTQGDTVKSRAWHETCTKLALQMEKGGLMVTENRCTETKCSGKN